MNLLENYISQKGKNKVTISNFFNKERDAIQKYCNNLQPGKHGLNLKLFWSSEIDKFASLHKEIKVTNDYYLIDFTDLELNRRIHIDNNQIKRNVAEARSIAVENMLKSANDDIFNVNSMAITNIIILNKLNKEKGKLSHVSEMHKKDLLYYSIIDLTTSSQKQSIYNVINKDQSKEFSILHSSKFKINKTTTTITIDIMKRLKSVTLKRALKEAKAKAKAKVRLLPESSEINKRVIKIVKVFRDALCIEDKLNGQWNEVEFTFFFLFPIFQQVFFDVPFSPKLGESHLYCAARVTNDDEHSEAGPKIDIIYTHNLYNLAISVCEVSGPNHKTNKTHFLGDRNKLSRNLKSILKAIEHSTITPNLKSFKKIKVFGIQVYLNTIYIYSMSKISYSFYLFLLEKKISIPTSLALLPQQLPTFIGSLFHLNTMYKKMNFEISDFLDISNNEDIPSSSNSEKSSPAASPHKKHKQSK